MCELGAVLAEVLLGNGLTARYAHLQMWRGSNLFDLAAKELGKIHSRPAVPDGELDARGPGVEGQDIIGGDRRFALDHASIARLAYLAKSKYPGGLTCESASRNNSSEPY